MSATQIPMLDLGPEIDLLRDELTDVIAGVLKASQFINGPNVKAFESEVAEFLGAEFAIGVNSGTDALVIGLRCLGVEPGDEVITTPFTFFATAEAVSVIGATPVFVDIDPATFNLDPAKVESALTDRTRAIIPVHLYGYPAAMDELIEVARARGVAVLEDVAQAFGATYGGKHLGTIGEVGAFSFFPSKNLGAYGDGGMIVTSDPALAETARMLRAHGGKHKYANEMIGYNSRLDEIQAAVLRVKLRVVESFNQGRRRVAARYNEAFTGVPGLFAPSDPTGEHVYHQYTIRIGEGKRDQVKERLSDAGIASTIYYPTPLHLLPVYAERNETFVESEAATGEVLSLPIWPQMDEASQDRVITGVIEAVGAAPGTGMHVG